MNLFGSKSKPTLQENQEEIKSMEKFFEDLASLMEDHGVEISYHDEQVGYDQVFFFSAIKGEEQAKLSKGDLMTPELIRRNAKMIK